jgi:hypothetical protein
MGLMLIIPEGQTLPKLLRSALESRRLDVAFTFVEAKSSPSGAWVAILLALSASTAAPQAYLHPGEYRFSTFCCLRKW